MQTKNLLENYLTKNIKNDDSISELTPYKNEEKNSGKTNIQEIQLTCDGGSGHNRGSIRTSLILGTAGEFSDIETADLLKYTSSS